MSRSVLSSRFAVRVAVSCVSLLLLATCWHYLAGAQFIPPTGSQAANEEEGAGRILEGILPDTHADEGDLRRNLHIARVFVEEGQHRRAAETYQRVLEYLEAGDNQDYFQPTEGDRTTLVSVRTSIDAWFASMPAEARQAYDLRYSGKARQMLEEAIEHGDADQLERVYRLYFYTNAGQSAAYLLGNRYLDQGDALRASLCFRRLKGVAGSTRFEPSLTFALATSLYQAGFSQEAVATLVQLRRRHPGASVRVGGRDVPLFADDRLALAWMQSISEGPQRRGAQDAGGDGWLVFRGDAARTATSPGGEPVLVSWSLSTSNNEQFVKGVDQRHGWVPKLLERFAEKRVVAVPSGHPLVVPDAYIDGVKTGPIAVFRTLSGLVIMDIATGYRVQKWEEAEPKPNEQPAEYSMSQFQAMGLVVPEMVATSTSLDALERRIWNEPVYGQLASDGERIYAIARTSVAGWLEDVDPSDDEEGESPPRTNVLQAFDVKGSKGDLLWEIDPERVEKRSDYHGAYFLGPPLPLGGSLYVLADYNADAGGMHSGEVRLLVIDPRHRGDGPPKLLWSQRLARFPETGEGNLRIHHLHMPRSAVSQLRRQAGLTPSYDDGLLVCPTGLGAVVTIDLTTRSLRWGYKYPVLGTASTTPTARMQLAEGTINVDRWADASVTIADGRVLLTPPLANHLHCVNLADGKKLWSAPREDGIYVAGVHRPAGGNGPRTSHAIVIGATLARAIPLAAGRSPEDVKPAWTCKYPEEKGVPCGRGFMSGDTYYLPFSSAQIAVIDLNTGTITTWHRAPQGRPPGNLVAHGDTILSQGAAAVCRFRLRGPVEEEIRDRLAKDPRDPAALLAKAEILLHDSRTDRSRSAAALAALRLAYAAGRDPYAGQLLADALLEHLQRGESDRRRHLADLGRMIDARDGGTSRELDQRTEYLWLLAEDHRQQKNVLAAFDAYTHLAANGHAPETLTMASDGVRLGREHGPRVAIDKLYQSADAEQRAALDDRIQKRFDAALSDEAAEPLWRFVRLLAFHPLAEKAQRELVQRAVVDGQVGPLQATWLLGRLEQSTDAATRRWAVAQRARLLAATRWRHDAAADYRRLLAEYAEDVCLDGQTGREVFNALAADSPVRAQMKPTPIHWPRGNIAVENNNAALQLSRRYQVSLEGDAPWVKETMLYFDPQTQTLEATDHLGQSSIDIDLGSHAGSQFARSARLCRAAAVGHLMVVDFGGEIVAVDMLAKDASGQAKPTVRWRHAIAESAPAGTGSSLFGTNTQSTPWGGTVATAIDSFTGTVIGRLGPVTRHYVAFQRGRDVIAVNPLTGRVMWTRTGVPHGSYLFGDENVLGVVSPGTRRGLLLSTMDGTSVGTPDLADAEDVVAVLGSQILVHSGKNPRAAKANLDPPKPDDSAPENPTPKRKSDPEKVEPRVNGELRLITASQAASPDNHQLLGRFAPEWKACVINQRNIVVMEPEGRLWIFDCTTAKPRPGFAGRKVELPGKPASIFATLTDGVYVVAVHRERNSHDQMLVSPYMLAFGDETGRPRIEGALYGFSAEGDQLWKTDVSSRQWCIDQPSGIPVVVLPTGMSRFSGYGRRGGFSVQCLDVRTGRQIHTSTRGQPPAMLRLSAIAEQNKVTLKLPDGTLTIRFHEPDKLPPPQP